MSVVDAVGELRTIGFFDDRAGTDREVAEAVIDDFRAMWGRLPTADDELLDLELPRFDPDRVWWEDTEADVAPGTDAYVRAIDGWAAISRGALRPSAVSRRLPGHGRPRPAERDHRGRAVPIPDARGVSTRAPSCSSATSLSGNASRNEAGLLPRHERERVVGFRAAR
jgi:hypothetical protein